MLRRAKHWHSRRAITSQGHQCDDASAVCTKAESSACFFSSEVQQESKHGLTSLPAASFSLVAARLSHAASPLSALSAPYCSQSQTSADRVDGSQQSKRCTVRSARIRVRARGKFACYLWEGYGRHTGPELHTGGMRGSKHAGFGKFAFNSWVTGV